ncbi:MAG: protein-L-isoaspartate O-methyltransferase [Pseudomonadota bacterium]
MVDFAARRTVMVDTQVRPADVTKFPIIEAMLAVPREDFVPVALREAAYLGEDLDLGGNRVILEPRTLAKLLDALDIQQTELVLDIGSSHGYSSAVIARLSEAVVALEDDEDVSREAQESLMSHGADNAVVHHGPLAEGAAEHGPYDVIVVEGGVEQVPDSIIEQLKDGGRIGCIFVEGGLGEARIGYKSSSGVSWRRAFHAGAPILAGFDKTREFQL